MIPTYTLVLLTAIPALKWNPTQIHAQRHPSQARDDVCFSQVGHGFLRRKLLQTTGDQVNYITYI